MKFLLVIACAQSYSFVSGQLCTELPPLSTIASDFRSAVNASDQIGDTFNLGEIFFNCITYGSPEGSTFRETTITSSYQVQDGVFLGQVLYACVSINGIILWRSDEVALKTGQASNGTERCMDCRELSATTCSVCTEDCGQGELNSDCSGCVCNDGYTGTNCDIDINECQAVLPVCEGGATCANLNGGFNCMCPEPCTAVDGCNACCSSPCTRGGTCNSTSPDNFTCDCPDGFTGKRCQDFLGGCHSDPCMNGGMCNTIGLSVDQYRCSCPVEFTGVNCEIEIDHCSDEPCRFQGWCTSDQTGHTCTCLHGFTGMDCGQPLLTCSSNPMACGNNGECKERTVDGFTNKICSCYPGYTGDSCDMQVDDCSKEPCFHRGTCIQISRSGDNSNVSFTCNCSDNWTGFYCTECLLECEEGFQPNAQCNCVCVDPSADNTCNPGSTVDPGSAVDPGLTVDPGSTVNPGSTADPGSTVGIQDPNANGNENGNTEESSNDDIDTGVIAGSVVGGVLIVGIAVVMTIIAIYLIAKSLKSKKMTQSSWMDATNNPFVRATKSPLPGFSGSFVGTSIFGQRPTSFYRRDNNSEGLLQNELSDIEGNY